MTQIAQNQGFTLPPLGSGPNAPPQPASASPDPALAATQAPSVVIDLGSPQFDTLARDLTIGAGVMLVLLIAFFFAKNAYANWLVGRRVSPRSANAAGWWVFILLTCLAAAGVFPLASQATFLSVIYLGPVLAVAGVALVLMLLSSRR